MNYKPYKRSYKKGIRLKQLNSYKDCYLYTSTIKTKAIRPLNISQTS